MEISLTVSSPQMLPVTAGAVRPTTNLWLVEYTATSTGDNRPPDDAFFVYRLLGGGAQQCCAVASYHQLKSLQVGEPNATDGFFRSVKGVFACYSLPEVQTLTAQIKEDLNLLVADWNAAYTMAIGEVHVLTGDRTYTYGPLSVTPGNFARTEFDADRSHLLIYDSNNTLVATIPLNP